MIKKAMILAAGYGKRIHPLTLKIPKPLLKINNETLLSNTIRFLKLFGIEEIIINVHYLGDQIINYIKENQFDLKIKLVEENNLILDTGGGILNAIHNFSSKSFLVINPDTIWNLNYLDELKLMEDFFLKNEKKKCILLLVNKNKSFDKSLKGDFNLKKNLIYRKKEDNVNLNYIYTGMQIIKPEVFLDIKEKIFSINKIWDQLIKNNQLYGFESKTDFLHVSTLDIYQNLIKEKFKH